ncbi:hypothetical protein FIV00_23715 [Labrenzia sp. THAF82]|uniref:hypothetical protein n=1 Tax=Labrenzia sp. THAF82 TaxID=2587861 RepID=UPI0012A7C219|nr:hypothetical protein [Labrenzia sp. THAF82]QFT33520.1 hypothetical protein FIV00_23715 [Labrenzia sp. THAF82]
MPSWSLVLWGLACLLALSALITLWAALINVYQRHFLDLSIMRFICMAGLN